MFSASFLMAGGQKEKNPSPDSSTPQGSNEESDTTLSEEEFLPLVVYYHRDFSPLFESPEIRESLLKGVENKVALEPFINLDPEEKALYLLPKETTRGEFSQLLPWRDLRGLDVPRESYREDSNWSPRALLVGEAPYLLAIHGGLNWQLPHPPGDWMDYFMNLTLPGQRVLMSDYEEIILPFSEASLSPSRWEALISLLGEAGRKNWELDIPYGHRDFVRVYSQDKISLVLRPSFHWISIGEYFNLNQWFLWESNLTDLTEGIYLSFSPGLNSRDSRILNRIMDNLFTDNVVQRAFVEVLLIKPVMKPLPQGTTTLEQLVLAHTLSYGDWVLDVEEVLKRRTTLELASRGVFLRM